MKENQTININCKSKTLINMTYHRVNLHSATSLKTIKPTWAEFVIVFFYGEPGRRRAAGYRWISARQPNIVCVARFLTQHVSLAAWQHEWSYCVHQSVHCTMDI